MTRKVCVDCRREGVKTYRKASFPGPRCATHHRRRRKELSQRRHHAHIKETYGITGEEYAALYEAQGGRCAICQRATGAKRRLAVDHDHRTGQIRGLLCKTCNYKILGHLRDDPEALQRAINYLENPPAFSVIGRKEVPHG